MGWKHVLDMELSCLETLGLPPPFPMKVTGSAQPYIMATDLYFSVLPIWCRIIIVLLQVNESRFRCVKKLDHKARK